MKSLGGAGALYICRIICTITITSNLQSLDLEISKKTEKDTKRLVGDNESREWCWAGFAKRLAGSGLPACWIVLMGDSGTWHRGCGFHIQQLGYWNITMAASHDLSTQFLSYIILNTTREGCKF